MTQPGTSAAAPHTHLPPSEPALPPSRDSGAHGRAAGDASNRACCAARHLVPSTCSASEPRNAPSANAAPEKSATDHPAATKNGFLSFQCARSAKAATDSGRGAFSSLLPPPAPQLLLVLPLRLTLSGAARCSRALLWKKTALSVAPSKKSNKPCASAARHRVDTADTAADVELAAARAPRAPACRSEDRDTPGPLAMRTDGDDDPGDGGAVPRESMARQRLRRAYK